MEDNHFYSLLKYFTAKISVQKDGDTTLVGRAVPLENFYDFSMEGASRFVGECNRNIKANEDSPSFILSELSNYLDKFNHIYTTEFGIEFSSEFSLDLEAFIPANRILRDELISAYKIKIGIYSFIFNYLTRQIKALTPVQNKVQTKSNRTKATQFDMVLRLKEDQFREIYDQMVRTGLIHEASSITDFINAFSGKRYENKIVWKGGYYRLSRFIKAINKRECFYNKVYDGIWEVVSNLFIPEDGSYFDPKKLAHSSASEGIDYLAIEHIADDIADYLHDEL